MSFSTTIKVIMGLTAACVIFLVFLAVKNPNPEATEQVQGPEVSIPSIDSNLLPEQLVRIILSRGSFNNPKNTWLPTQMSEPTPIAEILEVEDAWQSVYLDFQGVLQLSTSEMDLLWEKLTEQTSVGEWEAVIASEFPGESVANDLMQIQVPFATNNVSEIGPFGCGTYITFQTIEVPQSSAVLSSVYQQLFEITDFPNDGNTDVRNVVASQNALEFDSVNIENGNANLYLSGNIFGNHCADIEFRKQIEEAAFQFNTVNQISVYLNNEIFDWCALSDAVPEESGCDTNPKPWITEKEI